MKFESKGILDFFLPLYSFDRQEEEEEEEYQQYSQTTISLSYAP